MTLYSILKYLDLFAPTLSLFVIIVSVFSGRVQLAKADCILLIFIILQVLLNAIATYLQFVLTNNHWVYILIGLTSHMVFGYYFWHFPGFKQVRRLVIIGLMLYFIFGFISWRWIYGFNQFNSYLIALGSFCIVVYCLASIHYWFQMALTSPILDLKDFWISAGVLFYFGSSFLIFLSYHYLSVNVPGQIGIVWRIHNVFLAIACFLFNKAIFKKEWIRK